MSHPSDFDGYEFDGHETKRFAEEAVRQARKRLKDPAYLALVDQRLAAFFHDFADIGGGQITPDLGRAFLLGMVVSMASFGEHMTGQDAPCFYGHLSAVFDLAAALMDRPS